LYRPLLLYRSLFKADRSGRLITGPPLVGDVATHPLSGEAAPGHLTSLARVSADPLAPLIELPGVREAVDQARDAVAEVHRHPANRRGWPTAAAEASVRAARASAALDGGRPAIPADGSVDDPILAGALRIAEAFGGLLATWQRAPLQVLARLHVLAAADLSPEAALGRPRSAPELSARLDGLAHLVAGGSQVAAPVLVAVVHGELLTLAPFEHAGGVVARAAARLTAVASGLDPKGLVLPEVAHLRREREYRAAAAGFAEGTPETVAAWIVHCCAALRDGAKEATSIAESVGAR
jgi:hypothetical protein